MERWEQFLAITFDGADDAEGALKSIRALEHAGKVGLEDTAVVRKDADGKVTFHNEASSGTETGAAVGAVLGGLLFFVFPVGIAVGAVAGGLDRSGGGARASMATSSRRSGRTCRPAARRCSSRSRMGTRGSWSGRSASITAASARPRTTTTSEKALDDSLR